MNMLAKEYIKRYVHPDYQSYAKVNVVSALKGIVMPLEPDTPVPDEDDRNVQVFIWMDTMAMPALLIPDHNCKDGWVCLDHPEEPESHSNCYGGSIRCEYPLCEEEKLAEARAAS